MNDKEIQQGLFPEVVAYIAALVKKFDRTDPEWIIEQVRKYYPAFQNPERCFNCQSNMVQDIYVFDCLDAWLLIEMANRVADRFGKGASFTEANQIKVHDLPVSYSAKSRTTQMSKLGLIAQLQGKNKADKTVSVPGVWVITSAGWNALKGQPVRKRVAVWRGTIQDRFEDETITISEAFQLNRDKVDDLIKRNKKVKMDYRFVSENYNPQAWLQFGETTKGVLL